MNFLSVVLELVGAYAAASIAFTAGYATYLAISGRRQKIKWDHLAAFGLLSPVLWIGITTLLTLTGAYWGLLPTNLSALAYGAIAALIPTSALAASVIGDFESTMAPVSPSRETSRNSSSAPKRPSSNPPPPRHR